MIFSLSPLLFTYTHTHTHIHTHTHTHTPHIMGAYIYRTKHCKAFKAMTMKARQDPQSLKKMQLSLLHCNLLGLQFKVKHFWKVSRKKKKKAETLNRVFFLTLVEPELPSPRSLITQVSHGINLLLFLPEYFLCCCHHILRFSKFVCIL